MIALTFFKFSTLTIGLTLCVYIRAIFNNFSQLYCSKSLVVKFSSNIKDVKMKQSFNIFWIITLILTVLEFTRGSTEIEEQKREFGLDLVSNILGIVASSLSLLGHGTKFTGKQILSDLI